MCEAGLFQVDTLPEAECDKLPLRVACDPWWGLLLAWGDGEERAVNGAGGLRRGWVPGSACQVPTAKRLIRWESAFQPPRQPIKSSKTCEAGLSLSPGQTSSLHTTGRKGTSKVWRTQASQGWGRQAEFLRGDAQMPRTSRRLLPKGRCRSPSLVWPRVAGGAPSSPPPQSLPQHWSPAPRGCCCSSLKGRQSPGLPQTHELGEASGMCGRLALGHTRGLGFQGRLVE